MIAGQSHPEHTHARKKESFQILSGSMYLSHNGVNRELFPGEIATIEKGERHSFSSKNGVIFEEVSTTHYSDDSFYSDSMIDKNRKTKLNMLWN